MDKRTFRDRYEAVGRLTHEYSANQLMYKATALAVAATVVVVAKRAYDNWQENHLEDPAPEVTPPIDDNEVKGE